MEWAAADLRKTAGALEVRRLGALLLLQVEQTPEIVVAVPAEEALEAHLGPTPSLKPSR